MVEVVHHYLALTLAATLFALLGAATIFTLALLTWAMIFGSVEE